MKKLQEEKMQLLPKSGNGDRTLPDSGEHVRPNLVRSWPDQWPDPNQINGRIQSDPTGF
jgi:hypothetical protein